MLPGNGSLQTQPIYRPAINPLSMGESRAAAATIAHELRAAACMRREGKLTDISSDFVDLLDHNPCLWTEQIEDALADDPEFRQFAREELGRYAQELQCGPAQAVPGPAYVEAPQVITTPEENPGPDATHGFAMG